MTVLSALAMFAVGLSLTADSASAGATSPCDTQLSPLRTVAPKLPSRLHNEFVGKAVVSYVVDTAGRVRSVRILSSDWTPSGHSNEQPVGYAEAILAAVAQWQFAPQPQACVHQTPLLFEADSNLQSDAVRPNHSFKPTPLRGAA